MAITKITDPSALPTTTADYVAQNNTLNVHTLNLTPPFPVDFDNDLVLKGSIFNIGGDLFYTDADTSITGTASDYVKLVASTTSAVASYETATNISANVTWNQAYNGYYDASGNLYLFNESKAFIKGIVNDINTIAKGIGVTVGRNSFAAYGEPLSISSGGGVTSLDDSTIAYIGGDDNLITYEWDGEAWASVGAALNIAGTLNPAISALTSSTIAYVDTGNDELRTYTWNGSTWSQTGSSLSVTGGAGKIAALDSTTVAIYVSGTLLLTTYTWNGSTWSLTGTGLSVDSGAIVAINDSSIAHVDIATDNLKTYTWNGSTWSQTGTGRAVGSITSTPILAKIDENVIAYFDSTFDFLRIYRWDGSIWYQEGVNQSIFPTAITAMAGFSEKSDLAVIQGAELSTYKLVIGYHL